jgi:adenylate cyclase
MIPPRPKDECAFLLTTNTEGATNFPLSTGNSWRIGRADDNEIVLKSHVVSRYHAMIQRTEAEESIYYLIDMGSRNGSFVNNSRVSVPSALHTGDLISVGDRTMQFNAGSARPSRTLQPRTLDATTVTLFAYNKITVMVIDMRDFTGLTRRLEENILCQLIGTWFRKGGEILKARGSWGQKYIGDAMMSVWVHKEGSEPLEMESIVQALDELVEMTAGLRQQFGLSESIRVGVGLNTGHAMIGNAGSDSLTDHTALGDTVNAAFRFESASKQACVDVIIGNDTYAALGENSVVRSRFRPLTVSLKGYEVPWSVWGAAFADIAPSSRH